jgi:hypothetical protein
MRLKNTGLVILVGVITGGLVVASTIGVWEWRDHRFKALYDGVSKGDDRSDVLSAIVASGLKCEEETTASLTVVAKVGLSSSMVLDLQFDDEGKVISKDGFDTAVFAKWLF